MQSPESSPFITRNLRYTSILIGVAIITAFQIARHTANNIHPDEYVHIDAFCYYESHWWPPDLNADQLVYSPYGWSRVYDQELVYIVYGQLASLIRSGAGSGFDPTDCQAHAQDNVLLYRLLNVLLFLITLVILFSVGRKHLWSFLVGLLILVIPQVYYVYSYANSDAWGLSFSLFLFLFVLTHSGKLLDSWLNLLGLAGLTGLVLLSKQPYWLSLPFAYFLVGWSLFKEIKSRRPIRIGIISRDVAIFFVATFLIFAPLTIIYPYTQEGFKAKVEQMREVRAAPEFKPSQPTSPGYQLAARGFSIRRIVADPQWLKRSAESFYGRFGDLSVKPSRWLYQVSLAIFLLLILTTYGFMVFFWNKIPALTRLTLLITPPCVLFIILASMYHSWTFDYQPQGRYLFSAIAPLALMLAGAQAYEPRWLRGARFLAWIILYILCLYVLWFVLLQDPRMILR